MEITAYRFQDLAHLKFPTVQHQVVNFLIVSVLATSMWRPERLASLMHVRPQQISVSHFFPLKLMVQTLKYSSSSFLVWVMVFFVTKDNAWWAHKIIFFRFSPKFMRLFAFNCSQTQIKWRRLLKIWREQCWFSSLKAGNSKSSTYWPLKYI